jgi:hypothetical protein
VTHCLLHVADNIQELDGNLDAIAAWPFESLARILKPFLRTGFMPVNQLNNRLMERFVHHVPTFMDMIQPYGNRMKYVMGDISTTKSPQQRRQQWISSADLEKTAREYGKHMTIVSVQEAKQCAQVTTTTAAPNRPLRMYLGQGQRGLRQQQSAPQASKRLTFDSFELGNNYPNNCALVVDTRKWRQANQLKYHVIIIHDIFATKADGEDKLELRTLKAIREHIKMTSMSSNNPPPSPAAMAEGRRAASSTDEHEVLFRISGSKFQVQEPFTDYPVDSTRNHVYKVRKPQASRIHFLANQVCAKMIALPMVLEKPYNIGHQDTSSKAILEQTWHVAPLLHGLYLLHTKMESSFAVTDA